jgi:hypothetical protein
MQLEQRMETVGYYPQVISTRALKNQQSSWISDHTEEGSAASRSSTSSNHSIVRSLFHMWIQSEYSNIGL